MKLIRDLNGEETDLRGRPLHISKYGLSGFIIAETDGERETIEFILEVVKIFEHRAARDSRMDNDWRTTAKLIGAANAYEHVADFLRDCLTRAEMRARNKPAAPDHHRG